MENLLKLNLQYFAEEGTTTDTTTTTETNEDSTTTGNEENTESKVLTQEDVLKMIQSETDKVRSDYSKKLKDKEKELEDLKVAKMSAEDKKQHEEDLLRQENESLKKDKLRYIAIEHLAKNTLPLEVAEFVVTGDEASTIERIGIFKNVFDSAVAAKVNDTFKASGTQHVHGNGAVTVTKEDFNKMNVTERTKLFNENPELYKQLKK
ncbi:DUF4355 domain-containing protein [Psychrobacillus sp. BM2]|uniref:DUF4355 domain-containing protein n=1 Tax=Psychrobacillus sp. BM2 TaxID=3400421 RepID=UPI003B02458F